MKNVILKYGLLTLLWLTYTLPAMADPNDPDIDDDPPAPIDNWEIMLLIAGIIFGIYFLVKYRSKQIA